MTAPVTPSASVPAPSPTPAEPINDRAQRMFGVPPAPETPSTTPPREPEPETAVERMYRDAETLRGTYLPTLSDPINRIADETGLTRDQRAALGDELTLTFYDGRLQSGEMAVVAGLLAGHTRTPASREEQHEWAVQLRRAAREQWRDEADGDRRIARARQFLNARPTVLARLKAAGLQDHPLVILPLAARAYDLRIVPLPPRKAAAPSASR